MNTYIFREQVGEKGYYAEITLSATFEPSAKPGIVVDYNGDAQWEAACRCGIMVFGEHLSSYKKEVGVLAVKIQKIQWRPVDTNNLTVIFSTIHALAAEVKLEMPDLLFDRDKQIFIFPDSLLLHKYWQG